ncbi:MAG: ribosome maturation factor RimP [Polyangiaceae bacterium]|nr:ribosome maturation factor RimP [Polyangiaceae bacterium]
MPIAHDHLPGLDRERVLAAVEPVLAAHGVEGVELRFRTERGERVLELTLEKRGLTEPGAGITIELCSDVSRDLSVALDVADVISARYRLEVGSPGVERALYRPEDYARFAGRPARWKLAVPRGDQRVFRGILRGLDPEGRVLLEQEEGTIAQDLAGIESARLVFEWNTTSQHERASPGAAGRAKGRGKTSRAAQRKR